MNLLCTVTTAETSRIQLHACTSLSIRESLFGRSWNTHQFAGWEIFVGIVREKITGRQTRPRWRQIRERMLVLLSWGWLSVGWLRFSDDVRRSSYIELHNSTAVTHQHCKQLETKWLRAEIMISFPSSNAAELFLGSPLSTIRDKCEGDVCLRGPDCACF